MAHANNTLVTFFAGLVVGLVAGVVLLLLFPAGYWRIAETVSWRFHLPSVAQGRLEQEMTVLQLRGDQLVEGDDMLLFGDSHLQAVPAMKLGRSINYAIGGETAERLARRIKSYPSVKRARSILLMTGRNDLRASASVAAVENSMTEILMQIPGSTNVLLVAIPPGRDADALTGLRLEVNKSFSRLCSSRSRCLFVDLEMLADGQGRLLSRFDAGDGIHLNPQGYKVLLAAILAKMDKP